MSVSAESALSDVVLASGSAIRARILTDAGVSFRIVRPGVDEAAVKAAMADAAGEDVALALAEAKARAVMASGATAGAEVVVAADQILRFGGALFDKVDTMAAARARLAALSGNTHELVNGMVVARDGALIDRHLQISRLTMRPLSPAFLDSYLARAGEAILSSVGCYQFEGLGAQLFERVEGDFFAVLGLPLLPLLALLRVHGALDS